MKLAPSPFDPSVPYCSREYELVVDDSDDLPVVLGNDPEIARLNAEAAEYDQMADRLDLEFPSPIPTPMPLDVPVPKSALRIWLAGYEVARLENELKAAKHRLSIAKGEVK